MLFRRLALAIGLILAFLASQLPEFTQQYRQRLGGAVDELTTQIAQFDSEAAAQSLDRAQGIARLEGNADALAQARGQNVSASVIRRDRLDRQRIALANAGPVSQYAVLADGFDGNIARAAFADYQPAVPATPAGFVAALVGLVVGYGLTLLVTRAMRRWPHTVAVSSA